MKITKKHPVTGKENTLDLPVTERQLLDWNSGMLIQRAMPNLTADQREFLISGLIPGEFNEMFPEEDEDIDATDDDYYDAKGPY